VAATQVTGLREMFGSDTKSFHPGRAAQNGLMAAVLAQQGYTSSLTALEARRGWAACVSTRNNLDGLFATLGKTWETEANAFKPFPCGIVCHPAIDACIRLHQDLVAAGIQPEMLPKTLQTIQIQVHHLVIELTSKRMPRDGLEAKFSVFHGCAVGLLYGKAGPAQYADEVVANPNVVAIRDKVQAEISDSIAADQCKVEVKLVDSSTSDSASADGTVLIISTGSSETSLFSKYIEHALGSLEVEMTDQQLEEKFLDQCELVIGKSAKTVSDTCWSLEHAEDVGRFISQI
jgi:aconitate decarboxylase